MEAQSVITASNLSAGYSSRDSNKIVFENANFSIARGEFVGVLGPNGAGKTTLFKLLLGILKPISGEITVLGEKCQSSCCQTNCKIGYVPQRHTFNSESMIEALEIVRLGINGRKMGFSLPSTSRRERVEAFEMLKIVGAQDLAHRPLGALSGGEQQRIFLAQALVGNPDILFLDEPLASLDIRRENEFVRLIKKTAEARNITVLLIAHNINPLLPVINRVIYVANGRVLVGDADHVFTSAFLTKLYNSPVEVLRDSHGRIAIIGAEEGGHHHDHDQTGE
jgi:zinc/manganese transport system ATP-binding protein